MPLPECSGLRIAFMSLLFLALGVAGFAVLIAYVAFCERI